jgi:hypothetical protein
MNLEKLGSVETGLYTVCENISIFSFEKRNYPSNFHLIGYNAMSYGQINNVSQWLRNYIY